MRTANAIIAASVLALASVLGGRAFAVDIDWIAIGNAGNESDSTTGLGSVASRYQISKYEVTNAQYAEFLNATAASDPHGLYNPSMGSSSLGGIQRSGTSGSYTYGVLAERGSRPVTFVSFWDGIRFSNWMDNGQPVGAQASASTEDGAYTISPQEIAGNSIERNAGATIFLPSEGEWYKAAYYDAEFSRYFGYPAGSDSQTACGSPGSAPNSANCELSVSDLTEVGSYTASASPSGTFDQGGNAREWTETIIGSARSLRGGSFGYGAEGLAASSRLPYDPAFEGGGVGFRLASVPEPGKGSLLLVALMMLALWTREAGRAPHGGSSRRRLLAHGTSSPEGVPRDEDPGDDRHHCEEAP